MCCSDVLRNATEEAQLLNLTQTLPAEYRTVFRLMEEENEENSQRVHWFWICFFILCMKYGQLKVKILILNDNVEYFFTR